MHQEPSSQLQHGQHNLLVLLLCLYPPVPHQSIVSVNMDLHAVNHNKNRQGFEYTIQILMLFKLKSLSGDNSN